MKTHCCVDSIRRSIITLLDHFLLGLHYNYKHAGSLLAPDLVARRTLALLLCLPAAAAAAAAVQYGAFPPHTWYHNT